MHLFLFFFFLLLHIFLKNANDLMVKRAYAFGLNTLTHAESFNRIHHNLRTFFNHLSPVGLSPDLHVTHPLTYISLYFFAFGLSLFMACVSSVKFSYTFSSHSNLHAQHFHVTHWTSSEVLSVAFLLSLEFLLLPNNVNTTAVSQKSKSRNTRERSSDEAQWSGWKR